MASPEFDKHQSLPEENGAPWWQILFMLAIAAALCSGMCLLM